MKSLIDLEIIIAIISLVLCALKIFNIVEIPLMLINLLFIIMISIMTWINYKNNKRIQMFIGILIFIGFMTL
ncbi:hypothetical protein LZ906_016550 (plasmid) [Paraclostridium ghonii]|uniref:hypothetical protein n=1 Tax=Paraclostridium ghonii TaxID=29358 RepID=UPI00202CF159|nr:hypothetical protein [Paeniclostridium ghonii]MCM0166567.1 hypothetical protein [Paeniclostridium ghonii]